jgi:UDP-glucose 4-epimerase
MTNKIVVTGGCGYIGSHVARAFKQNGDEVLIIDRVKREHTLKDIDGYYIGDFANDDSLATLVDFNPDIVVHCAGTSLVGPSMANPSEYYNNNVAKTIKMMDVIKGLDRRPAIMFSSSASTYGEPESLPIPETARIQPISPYGNTKAADEMILKDYGNAYGIDVMCFRYFNAAGACPVTHDLGQEPEATHIVARVLEASIANKAFTINGSDFDTPDGTCIRDYVHVWDIALAHVRAAGFFAGNIPGFAVGVRTSICMSLNLGTNTGVSNKMIVDYVAEKYGLPFVNYGPKRPGDPDQLVADSSEARRLLGWEPVNSNIKQIIDDAYKWYTR